ncbi:MAG: acyl-CoA thioesterase [Ignavibacteriae bacterium]|nr:acyl-CoA thioesterase [Ignavibacteriota bacterium]
MKNILSPADFRHKVEIRVRTWEVDWERVVHNSNFLRYMEIGRFEYKRNLESSLNACGSSPDGLKVFVVHNSVDYLAFAKFDDVLNIYTRIAWIKNSSFCFEHIIEQSATGNMIATGKGILVNVNPLTNLPEKLHEKFSESVIAYDKNVVLLSDKSKA